jgi:hypothetical protein
MRKYYRFSDNYFQRIALDFVRSPDLSWTSQESGVQDLSWTSQKSGVQDLSWTSILSGVQDLSWTSIFSEHL